MNIAEYKQIVKQPLRPRTLTFLMKDTQVLLGWKKTGFGKDYLLGIGGKVESGETIEAAAKREVAEEIHVVLPDLQSVGVLDFYFPHIEDESWNQQVHVFITTSWEGTPQESEEIQPDWFEQQQVPYDRMWDDARYWLPHILTGQRVEGAFLFNQELKVTDHHVTALR